MIMAGFEMAVGAGLAIGAGLLALFALGLVIEWTPYALDAFGRTRAGQWIGRRL
jgi:hypothetical protein